MSSIAGMAGRNRSDLDIARGVLQAARDKLERAISSSLWGVSPGLRRR